MTKIKSWAQPAFLVPIFLILILILFPVEHKYDKLFRSTFRSWHISEDFTKNFYLYITDFLGISFFVLCLTQGIKQVLWQKSAKYLAALIGLSFLSILFCDVSTFQMQWVQWIYFSIPLLFFCSVQSLDWNPDVWIPRLLWVILGVALFECFVGMYQFFTQHAIGLKLLGEPRLEGDRATFSMGSFQVMRAYGTFPHPNVLGGFLVFSLFSTYALWMQSEKKGVKAFILCALAAQLLTMFFSFSRSAMIGWALASVLWMLWMRKNRKARFLSFVIGGLFLATTIALYPQLKSRGGIINYNALSKGADSERLEFQRLAFRMIQSHPVKGVGYGNMGKRNEEFLEGEYPDRYLHAGVHNIYLYIAAEIGLFGLLAFLGFLFSVLRAAFYSLHCPLRVTLFSLFLGFLFIGGCDFYLLQFQQGKWMFMITALWITSLSTYERNRVLEPQKV